MTNELKISIYSSRLLADNKPCPYCSKIMHKKEREEKDSGTLKDEPTLEHIFPASKKGRIVIVVCSECNNEKGDMYPYEWLFHTWFEAPDKFKPSLQTFLKIKGVIDEDVKEVDIINALESTDKHIRDYKELVHSNR